VNYLKKFFDSNDGTASLRNAAFALVIVAGIIYLGAQLVVGLVKTGTGITADWNMGLGIIATAATGSKLIGQAIHNEATDPSDTQKGVKE
jgi:hypothetical protein